MYHQCTCKGHDELPEILKMWWDNVAGSISGSLPILHPHKELTLGTHRTCRSRLQREKDGCILAPQVCLEMPSKGLHHRSLSTLQHRLCIQCFPDFRQLTVFEVLTVFE